ncbi:MAG: DNA translocase FtsK, partial [Oscillospiraceae bacterium]|nr:DNA translocase FtsK [Oscillospiraceae bacterium]
MLCTLVSYFGVDALLIRYLSALLKGLFGYGYYFAAPALFLMGAILLLHRGRPVRARTVCAGLLPLFAGSLLQLFFTKEVLGAEGFVKTLWESGLALKSGGVLAGLLSTGLLALVGKVVSIILVLLILAVLLLVTFHVTSEKIAEKIRDRERGEYKEEDYEDDLISVIQEVKGREKSQPKPKKKINIDIPVDDEPLEVPAKEEDKPKGFFRPKPAGIKSPAEALQEEDEAAAEEKIEEEKPAEVQPLTKAPLPLMPDVEEEEEEPAKPKREKPSSMTRTELEESAREVADSIEKGEEEEKDAYIFPPITLLNAGRGDNAVEAGAELRNNSRRLGETLTSFGVDAKPGIVVRGPSVTRYEYALEQGVKLSKITNLSDDIALALGASGVRIAPIPDKISVVGIEVPNKLVSTVSIRDVIESRDFVEHPSKVAFAIGRDIGGSNIIGNIAKLPHVLIAGTTGSGKSVCTNSLIISLMYKASPDDVRFIMVDPKMVELAPYNGIPHLLIPVVTDPKKAAGALQWAVFEMMKRYKTFSEHGVKDLAGYNALAENDPSLKHMASVVVVIDELADLMLVAAKEVEESICRVAQMGRAAGMHLVIATQRPSADVITGLMKANIPSRIAFSVASGMESRIILDNTGAEKLVGRGDMLYSLVGGGKPKRVQGCFIAPEEIERVVEFVKSGSEVQYSQEVMDKIEEALAENDSELKKMPTVVVVIDELADL